MTFHHIAKEKSIFVEVRYMMINKNYPIKSKIHLKTPSNDPLD